MAVRRSVKSVTSYARRVHPRDPLDGWWMPPDKRIDLATDEDLEDAVSEALQECCEDDIDLMVVESLFIANLSLRKAEDLTGIPKTTIARRRDGLKVRLANFLEQEPSVQKRLVTAPAHQQRYL